MNGIAEKIHSYIQSPAFEAKVKPIIEGELEKAADDMVMMLQKSSASVYGPRGGKVFDPNAWAISGISGVKMSWEVNINYIGNKTKASLYPKGYPSGIENVLALFHNGMTAGSHAYGSWRGGRVSSVTSITADPFIANAVNEFNSKYAAVGYTAKADGAYQ